MKLIDQYRAEQTKLEAQIKKQPSANVILAMQELNYRISVLETVKTLSLSVPKTTDMKQLGGHYKIALAYLQLLAMEHKFGSIADEALTKKRATANDALVKVIKDGSKRFSGFEAEDDEQYAKMINAFIVSVLDVWVPYRNTYTEIKVTDKSAEKKAPAAETENDAADDEDWTSLSLEEMYKRAIKMPCPLPKYKGKTLGQLAVSDPNLINWLATKYTGDKKVIAAALAICKYAEDIA